MREKEREREREREREKERLDMHHNSLVCWQTPSMPYQIILFGQSLHLFVFNNTIDDVI